MEYESGVSAEEGDRTDKNRKRRIGEEQGVWRPSRANET